MAAIELASTTLFSDANLVAYYKLEDVNDSKGSRTLTNTNSVAFNAAFFNNGADFGNANSNKRLERTSDNYGIAGNGDFSISFWVKITGAPGVGTAPALFYHSSTTTSDRNLQFQYFNTAGTRGLQIDNSNNSGSYNVDLGTSIFNHLCMVRIGTTGTKLYVNGVDVGLSVAQGSNTNSLNAIYIAQGGPFGGGYLSGIIDDFAIFSRQLTAADVSLLFNGPSTSQDELAYFM